MSSKTDDFNLDFLNDIDTSNPTNSSGNSMVGGNQGSGNGATGSGNNNGSTNSGNNAVPSGGQANSNTSNDEFNQLFNS